MYTINKHVIHNKGNAFDIFNIIKKYLAMENLVIVSQDGIPMEQDAIYSILKENEAYNFSTVSIFELENETISEAINYLDRIILEIEQIINLEIEVNLLSVLTDLLDGIDEISILDHHFNINVFIDFSVHQISLNILSEFEAGNQNYLLDILEFEFLPKYKKLQTLLKERKTHNELPNS